MRLVLAMLLTLPLLAACAAQPEPLCDREAQAWDKYGTQEDLCMAAPVVIPGLPPVDDPHDPTPPYPDCPPCPSEPPSEPPVGPPPSEPPVPPSEPPSERVKGNNGLGNGDQTAPGNSLDRNRAENQRGNPGHASGKAQNSN